MTRDPKIRCAILGPGGYIGQHFVRLLADHPIFGEPLLAAGTRTEGKRLGDVWQLPGDPPRQLSSDRMVRWSPASLGRAGVRVVFSALPTGKAGALERAVAARGIAVFSNASDLRRAPGVPLLVPEVNPGQLALLRWRPRGTAPVVTNPNCSATGLSLALRPLTRLLRPRSVHVATYQSLSGAGFPGIASLSITDNVVPFIADEEEKLSGETRLLLGETRGRTTRPWSATVSAQCVRVGTREGHLEAVTIEARERPQRQAILDAWRGFDPLRGQGLPTAPHPVMVVRGEADRPQPLRDRWAGSPEGARGMAVSVGRIRWEPPFLRFFLLSHNAVRGGAGGSVLNAELLHSEGWLTE
jgi:aspartate-semialdehyde dehydrogenase